MITKTNSKSKSFLRWAGGKRWLTSHIASFLPKNGFNNYHEPFLGGGSIFLSLRPANSSFLSDSNEELINCYKCLKENVLEVIQYLKEFKNTKEFYYDLRDADIDNKTKRAAIFIYLNQTSFNGIYRVNLKGKYNVPYGFRTKDFLDEETLINISSSLRSATLFTGDFDLVRKNIRPNDLVFLDPPYTVSHNLNGFIKYNQKLFSLDDQYRLASLIDYIKSIGAFYILTNAAHAKVFEIFDKGDSKIELNRACVIGGLNAKRGNTSEYIFTNCIE
ncbi:Dam family site-specific DNA-(adenine-N6)-methyltransferase [Flavihumibacter sp. R14]|nr:Dam family site-specific DNA-(adenine-N6)-methyltransferase [Flavihumibacter soli]